MGDTRMQEQNPWVVAAAAAAARAAKGGTAVIDPPAPAESAAADVPTPAPAPAVEVIAATEVPAIVVPELAPDPEPAPEPVVPVAAASAAPAGAVTPEALAQALAILAAQNAAAEPVAEVVPAPRPAAPVLVDPQPVPDPEPEPVVSVADQVFAPLPQVAEPAAASTTKPGRKKRRGRKAKQVVAEVVGEDAPEEPTGPPQTAKWTGGNAIAAKAWAVLIFAGLATGPVAVALYVLDSGQEVAAPVVEEQAVPWDSASVAGDRARQLVGAWLGATRTDNSRLQAIYTGSLTGLPSDPQEAQDISVAQVKPAGEGLWSVLVGADVKVPEPTEKDPAAMAWVRQFFQVPVAVATTDQGLGVQVLALPSPMPAPVTATGVTPEYRQRIASTTSVGQSVNGFLNAMVAGSGDLNRYMTPGTALSPISPVVYSAAEVSEITAVRSEVDVEDPEQGARLDLRVNATLTRLDGQRTTTTYALQVTARDSRWEISAVSQAPTLAGAQALVDQELPAVEPEHNATPSTAGATDGGNA